MAPPELSVELFIDERLEPSGAWSRLWSWLLLEKGDEPAEERGHQSPEVESDDGSES